MTEEPEPLRYTGHLIRRAQQRHAAVWQEFVSIDVSSVQYAALAILERRPGASQSELGAELDLDRSTIADIVVRLERRGAIVRTPHESDRRRYSLTLTEQGAREVDTLRPLVAGANELLTAKLTSSEISQLRELLRKVLTVDAD